mmetsp:Transcript_38756/g.95827  ORF Transcript_38756/g.95827 Transcript_38756/m.95827 type:complete len:202 (-) Transcript_38756:110-715(-)
MQNVQSANFAEGVPFCLRRLSIGEGQKRLAAERERGCLLCQLDAKGRLSVPCRVMPLCPAAQRVRHGIGVQVVAVDLAPVCAHVVIGRGSGNLAQHEVVWQHLVHAITQQLEVPTQRRLLREEAGKLPARVHARIGATRSLERDRLAHYAGEHVGECRAYRRVPRPAARPVVRDEESCRKAHAGQLVAATCARRPLPRRTF